MLSNNKVVYFVVSVVVAFSSVFSVANAQDDAGTLEEIIVTAQKREQSVQDVGLTVAAFTDEQYRELTRGTLDGLAAQISNLQAYANNTFLKACTSAASA